MWIILQHTKTKVQLFISYIPLLEVQPLHDCRAHGTWCVIGLLERVTACYQLASTSLSFPFPFPYINSNIPFTTEALAVQQSLDDSLVISTIPIIANYTYENISSQTTALVEYNFQILKYKFSQQVPSVNISFWTFNWWITELKIFVSVSCNSAIQSFLLTNTINFSMLSGLIMDDPEWTNERLPL